MVVVHLLLVVRLESESESAPSSSVVARSSISSQLRSFCFVVWLSSFFCVSSFCWVPFDSLVGFGFVPSVV